MVEFYEDNKRTFIISKFKLEQILFQLKYNYDELRLISTENKNQIKEMNKTLGNNKSVDLSRNNIISLVKNKISFNSSKEDLSTSTNIFDNENKVKLLNLKKHNIKTKLEELSEDRHIIYLIEKEKSNNTFILREIAKLNNKIIFISKNSQAISDNQESTEIKIYKSCQINQNLESEKTKLLGLYNNFGDGISKIDHSINISQAKNKILTQIKETSKSKLELENDKIKQNILEKYSELKSHYQNKMMVDMSSIKIILGLSLIKRNLDFKENLQDILKTDDYKVFKYSNFNGFCNVETGQFVKSSKKQSIQVNNMKLNSEYLKQKFEFIKDISFEEINNLAKFISLNRYNYKKQIDFSNKKQYELIKKKELLLNKVKFISFEKLGSLVHSLKDKRVLNFISKIQITNDITSKKIYTFELDSKMAEIKKKWDNLIEILILFINSCITTENLGPTNQLLNHKFELLNTHCNNFLTNLGNIELINEKDFFELILNHICKLPEEQSRYKDLKTFLDNNNDLFLSTNIPLENKFYSKTLKLNLFEEIISQIQIIISEFQLVESKIKNYSNFIRNIQKKSKEFVTKIYSSDQIQLGKKTEKYFKKKDDDIEIDNENDSEDEIKRIFFENSIKKNENTPNKKIKANSLHEITNRLVDKSNSCVQKFHRKFIKISRSISRNKKDLFDLDKEIKENNRVIKEIQLMSNSKLNLNNLSRETYNIILKTDKVKDTKSSIPRSLNDQPNKLYSIGRKKSSVCFISSSIKDLFQKSISQFQQSK